METGNQNAIRPHLIPYTQNIIDSYVTNLASHEEGKKLQLHYWYIGEHEIHGEMFRIGHGIVTGHKKLSDAMDMHTSAVEGIHIDEEAGELVLTTRNSVYHCPLAYCSFKEQDEYPDIIPDYEGLKEKYKGKIEYPSIESGKVLLVLANFCDYYFHSLYMCPMIQRMVNRLSSMVRHTLEHFRIAI